MPISSSQIGGMIGGQQAMFGNFASYSQQISAGQNGGGGMTPTYQNPMAGAGAAFMPPPPPMSQQFGHTSPAVMSGLMNMGGTAFSAATMAGSFLPGRIGGAMMATDPTMAGVMAASRATGVGFGSQGMFSGAGWRNMGSGIANIARGGIGSVARAGITGLGAGIMAAAPLMAVGQAAGFIGGQMIQGAQFSGQVDQSLQQNFRHQNSQSSTGYGFSREESKGISDMMRNMGMKDMMTTPQELLGVMNKGAQMGMFKAVQDAKSFKDKFKETVGALKQISEVMNTTLEGAMPFFQQSKQMGFWSPQDIQRQAAATRGTAVNTGMSVAETQQMMGQGAAMARSIGAHGASGAIGMQQSLGMVGGALRSGVINEQSLSEATGGLSGSEAISAMAGTMQRATTRFARSGRGRWMMAAMANKDMSGFDPGAMAQMASGNMSIGDIRSMAEKNVSGRGNAMNFVANEENLRGEMVKQGPEAQLGFMRAMMGDRIHSGETKDKLIVKRQMKRMFGMGGREAELMQELARASPQIMRENQQRMDSAADNDARGRERMMDESIEGIKRKIGSWFDKSVKDPLQQIGSNVNKSIQDSIEGYSDKMFGRAGRQFQFRGATTGAIQGLQKAAMGDEDAMAASFGNFATGDFSSLGGPGMRGGGGLGAMQAERANAERMAFAKSLQRGGIMAAGATAGSGIGAILGLGVAGVGLGMESMLGGGDVTTDKIELMKKLGVGEHSYATPAEREEAIAGGGMTRSSTSMTVPTMAYRTMASADIEKASLGLMAASGVMTDATAGGIGFGSKDTAVQKIAGAQADIMSKEFQVALAEGAMKGGSGVDRAKKLVSRIRSGDLKVGANLKDLVGKGNANEAAMRLIAATGASDTGRGGIGLSVSDELTTMNNFSMDNLKNLESQIQTQMTDAANNIADKIGWAGDADSILELQKDPEFQSALGDFGRGEKGQAAGQQKLMRLMRTLDPEKDKKKLTQITAMLKNPEKFKKDLETMGQAQHASNTGSLMEVHNRRMGVMRESMGKNQDAIIQRLNSQVNREGDKLKLGDQIKGIMDSKGSPVELNGRIQKLIESASGADPGVIGGLLSGMKESGVEGTSLIEAALGEGMKISGLMSTFRKGGKGAAGATAGLLNQLGASVELSSGEMKILQKGSGENASLDDKAKAEKVRVKLMNNFGDDHPNKEAAARLLDAASSGEVDKLVAAQMGTSVANVGGTLGSADKSIMHVKRESLMKSRAGDLDGLGSPAGQHRELGKQTALLDELVKHFKGKDAGMNAGKDGTEKNG